MSICESVLGTIKSGCEFSRGGVSSVLAFGGDSYKQQGVDGKNRNCSMGNMVLKE